jgi:hypothetical protein
MECFIATFRISDSSTQPSSEELQGRIHREEEGGETTEAQRHRGVSKRGLRITTEATESTEKLRAKS